MKRNIFFFFLLIHTSLFSQESGIEFKEGTWDEALLAAKQSKKPLFIYVYSTACHFCRKMEKNIFPDGEVSTYYNETFVDYKLNLDKEQGAALGKQFHILGTPAYLYFDKEGNLLHRSGSEKSASAFIQDGKNAFDSTKAYAILKSRYDREEHSAELLYDFSNALLDIVSDAPDIRNAVMEEYLQSQDNEALSSRKNREYIFKQATTIDAPATIYYLKMQQPLTELFGEEAVQAKNTSIIRYAASEAGDKNDTAQLIYIKQLLSDSKISNYEQLTALSDVKYLLGIFLKEKENWEPYAAATIAYGKKFAAKDNFTLRETATYFHYYAKKKETLQKALQIINMAVTTNKSYDNLLMQAKLLHQLGQKKKAVTAANSAINAATPDDDTRDAGDLLEKIKKRQKG